MRASKSARSAAGSSIPICFVFLSPLLGTEIQKGVAACRSGPVETFNNPLELSSSPSTFVFVFEKEEYSLS